MTQTSTDTVRIGDAQYGRPFRDERGDLLVQVWYDDGESLVTYHVTRNVWAAWAAVDANKSRCPGCGRAFAGERGLRSHQTAKFVAMGCRPRA